MSKDSITDYLSCILFRILGPFIRNLPKKFSFFLGRRLGDLLYYFDARHKAIAYSNIKLALGSQISAHKLNQLTREFFRTFGENLIEIFFIPSVNKEYLDKYINIEGLDNLALGFRKGKGVILVGVHAGSWELSNIISANIGLAFSLFVRDQRYPRLNRLLNLYRSQKGCKLIQRQNQTRQLIEALQRNETVGMTIDQGGKTGELVKFFGKDASMATGAIRIALEYGTAIIPAFYTRLRGPYIKVILQRPFEIRKTVDRKKDVRENLQELISIFEKYIAMYPKEYLWSYRIWKYGRERDILILSDGKTGHLRQAQSVANTVTSYLGEKGIRTHIDTREVKFKNRLSRTALTFSSCLAGKYHCQGCLWCMRTFLKEDTYKSLVGIKPDVIISCGSQLAPINFLLTRENLAKSIVIMQPSILSTKKFDLEIIPRHDKPPRRKNIVLTEGALNLIDEQYLREQSEKLLKTPGFGLCVSDCRIGFLIGGDTKNFRLDKETVLKIIKEIKSVSEKLDAAVLVTTSRRTSPEIENLVKAEFKDYSRCKLLVIANEKNIPEAMGGILGLSQIIVISPESISMISEAVKSKKYVVVFDSLGLDKKHKRFIRYFLKNKYIHLPNPDGLARAIEDIWRDKPKIHTLSDNLLITEALKKIL